MKQRMGTADVAAETASLRAKGIIGMRLVNVYDITSKIYVFKFAKSGEDSEKLLLLVESGARFHTIDDMPDKPDVPSNFVLKLRKHLRTRRLEGITQLGVDRIVRLTFGTGEKECHVLLEFYAQGNIMLTDHHYQVLTLLRSHRDDAKGIAMMSRHTYPIHSIRLRKPVTRHELDSSVDSGKQETLKIAVSNAIPYGPNVALHCIVQAGLDPAKKLSNEEEEEGSLKVTETERIALMNSIAGFEKWLDDCEMPGALPGGVIRLSPDGSGYIEFEPLWGDDFVEKPFDTRVLSYPRDYDAAISEYFGRIAAQRNASQQAQREKTAMAKLEAIRKDHQSRVINLQTEVETAEEKAVAIESNLEKVDAALNAVKDALEGGMDWKELERLIKEERKAGNPVAALIHSLQLDKGRVTLSLQNPSEGVEEETRSSCIVQVDVELSAAANARTYYEARKKFAESNELALEAAERKVRRQLESLKVASQSADKASAAARKHYWFEKFNWFISSENYLVISGRDAQQNELLVKRYMEKCDVYVHADLHGASSTIVKNIEQGSSAPPIPPLTLAEAGQACVCRSSAWNSKISSAAWWVYPEQVSKTAPTGEYLTTGSFMIRGRKNYLSAPPLVMGLAFLFRLEPGCIAAHVGERAARSLMNDEQNPIPGVNPTPTALEEFMEGMPFMDHLITSSSRQDSNKQDRSNYLKTNNNYRVNSRKDSKGGQRQPAKNDDEKGKDVETQNKKGPTSRKGKKKMWIQEQDEEEKEIAKSLFGFGASNHHNGNKKDRKAKKEERKERMAMRKALQKSGGSQSNLLPGRASIPEDTLALLTAQLHPDDNNASDNNANDDSASDDSAGDDSAGDDSAGDDNASGDHAVIPDSDAQDSTKEKEDFASLLAEEGIEELEEEMAGRLTQLDELTGIPRPEDVLLHAIPVCAPYRVVAGYKYKVKLVPGTLKKGKAFRQAVELLVNGMPITTGAPAREGALLRAVPESEGIDALVGGVRLQVAGLLKMQQAKKAKGKNNRSKSSE
jgi:predicted ribosome quality control (RQC) complex YloA/Tae2 family protein